MGMLEDPTFYFGINMGFLLTWIFNKLYKLFLADNGLSERQLAKLVNQLKAANMDVYQFIPMRSAAMSHKDFEAINKLYREGFIACGEQQALEGYMHQVKPMRHDLLVKKQASFQLLEK